MRNVPVRLIRTTSSQAETGYCAMGTRGPRKLALFTSTSSLPNCSSAACTIAFACAGSLTSPMQPCASPPMARISATARLRSASLRAQISTPAPSRAYAMAIALPMPRLPPVMSAIFPFNFSSLLLAITKTLSHSDSIGETNEKLPKTPDLRAARTCSHRSNQPLGGNRVGFDLRRRNCSAGGPYSLFTFLRPIFHGLRHSSLLCVPIAAQDRVAVSIGPCTADAGSVRRRHRGVPPPWLHVCTGLHHVGRRSL